VIRVSGTTRLTEEARRLSGPGAALGVDRAPSPAAGRRLPTGGLETYGHGGRDANRRRKLA
jgi:hypothetical protein